MQRIISSMVVLFFAVAVLGCQSMGEKTKSGALLGGLIGAGAGGIIGHQSGHGLGGAAIGAAAGAIGGGLIGNQLDKADQQSKENNPNHLGILGIVDMTSKGVPADVIIDEIQRTKSVYNLTSETIDYLKKNNVSNKVIDAMLATVK
ncbi:MAG: glycine zipper domain-containing protein [Candidatus Omnitrophica bacterium]|nr:glycine zipper domain-containing protein [Candidatus Omnitrophota bacterium]MDD5352132.1 glycine zipper domain-containing protein [Candidatus Omnitrophota bacterium]MDD5549730.1 glycine zipper domain-containing protein [Candidatus Omnitrophota bacterium]